MQKVVYKCLHDLRAIFAFDDLTGAKLMKEYTRIRINDENSLFAVQMVTKYAAFQP